MQEFLDGLKHDLTKTPVPYVTWILAGLICSITGPFGTYYQDPLWFRFIFWFGIMFVAVFGGISAFRFARNKTKHKSLLHFFLLGWAIWTPIYTVFIYTLTHSIYPPGFPPTFGVLAVVTGVATAAVAVLNFWFEEIPKIRLQRALAPRPPQRVFDAKQANPLLSQIDLDLDTRLIRLAMRDHYVEAHTDQGMQLVHMRFADAVAALTEMNGEQTHRSHWVNFDEITEVLRQEGKYFFRMSDGFDVPIARSRITDLRNRGVI